MIQEVRDEWNSKQAVPLVYHKIPVRNVWLLFLYAYDLAQFRGRFQAEIENSPDFQSLIARLLCYAVEHRFRRNLSFGYRHRKATLRRVRGRIDMLETMSRELFRRGAVACRFDEFTVDTPRNRFVRAALSALGERVSDPALAHRTRTLANVMGRAGVSAVRPSRAEIATDQLARHEADDRLMVSLAWAVFELILPMETEGARSLLEAKREDTEFRKLFERAVGKFFDSELSRDDGWRVYPGKKFIWPVDAESVGIQKYLPTMKTDIILENVLERRRIIIDTKFTEILVASQYGEGKRFKTNYIYQIYSYIRSQERLDDPLSIDSEGMLLHPAMDIDVDETALIQGHRIRFATIDLAAPTSAVVERLRTIPLYSKLTEAFVSD